MIMKPYELLKRRMGWTKYHNYKITIDGSFLMIENVVLGKTKREFNTKSDACYFLSRIFTNTGLDVLSGLIDFNKIVSHTLQLTIFQDYRKISIKCNGVVVKVFDFEKIQEAHNYFDSFIKFVDINGKLMKARGE